MAGENKVQILIKPQAPAVKPAATQATNQQPAAAPEATAIAQDVANAPAIDITDVTFTGKTGQTKSAQDIFGDSIYSKAEQEEYGEKIQEALELYALTNNLEGDWTQWEASITNANNETSTVTKEDEAQAAQEAVQEAAQDATKSLPQAQEYFNSEEQTEILTALFGDKFKQAGYNDEQIAQEIQKMKPTDAFWSNIKYDPATGETSLTVEPFDDRKPSAKIDGPWKFAHELYGEEPWRFHKEQFEIIAKDQTFRWGQNVTFSGTVNVAAQEGHGKEVADTSGLAAPEKETQEVDLTLTTEHTNAEGMRVNIGEAGSVDFLGIQEADENGIYKGTTNLQIDGVYQYGIVTPNADGTVTVSYYNTSDFSYDNAGNIVDTPTIQTRYNKDGSTVQVETDYTTHDQTTKHTSADGQYTSVTRDTSNNITRVDVNGEKYGNDGQGHWYQIGTDNKPLDENNDGFPDVILSKEPLFGEDNSITLTTGSEESPYVRSYNSDGTLSALTVNGQCYDMSKYAYNKEYNSYTRLTSADGSIKQSITFMPDGKLTIQEFSNKRYQNATYDNGKLCSIAINGKTYDGENLIKTENGYSIKVNGAEKPLKQNSNGVFAIDYTKTSIEDWDANNNTISLPDGKITFTQAPDLANAEKGEYAGMTADGYVVVSKDEQGNVTVNVYESKDAYDTDLKNPENAKGPKTNNTYYIDGAKYENKTIKDETTKQTINTQTVTDGNGRKITVTDTYNEQGVISSRISQNYDGQSTKIEYDPNKQGIPTKVTIKGAEYTPATDGSGNWVGNNGNAAISFNEDGSINIVENNISKKYDVSGALQTIQTPEATYDLSNYQYNGNGTYTKPTTTDGSIINEIKIDGSVVTSTDKKVEKEK